jgi:hypothetical protein
MGLQGVAEVGAPGLRPGESGKMVRRLGAAAASMANDGMAFTSGAAPQDDFGAARGPITFELVRRDGKWAKQNRSSSAFTRLMTTSVLRTTGDDLRFTFFENLVLLKAKFRQTPLQFWNNLLSDMVWQLLWHRSAQFLLPVTRPHVKIQAPVVVAIKDVGVLSADLTNSSRLSLILREKTS